MSVFLSLPDEVCRDILSWFDVKEYGLLDAALCSKKYQKLYRQYLSCCFCNSTDSRRASAWLYDRSIKIIRLKLHKSTVAMGRKHRITFPVDFSSVMSLDTSEVEEFDVCGTINSCVNLKELNISGELFNATRISAEVLASLTSLKIITKIVKDGLISLRWISEHCHSLQTFSYSDRRTSCDNAVLSILRNNPSLTCVDLSVDSSLLPTIIDCCPNLIEIRATVEECVTHVATALCNSQKLSVLEVHVYAIDPTNVLDLDNDRIIKLTLRYRRVHHALKINVLSVDSPIIGWNDLVKEFHGLQCLFLSTGESLDHENISALFAHSSITYLDLVYYSTLTDDVFQSTVGKLPNLLTLKIHIASFWELQCLPSLASLACVEYLTISVMQLEAEALNHFKGHPTLMVLSVKLSIRSGITESVQDFFNYLASCSDSYQFCIQIMWDNKDGLMLYFEEGHLFGNALDCLSSMQEF